MKLLPRKLSFIPEIRSRKTKQDFILKYPECDNYYGIAWNYQETQIREVLDDNLESFFRKKTHDHVSSRLIGNREWHYSNAFLRPIVLAPHSEQTIYALVCTGTSKQVNEQIEKFHSTPEAFISSIPKDSNNLGKRILSNGKKYEFGHRLLQSALLSNIVYPVHTQGQYTDILRPARIGIVFIHGIPVS